MTSCIGVLMLHITFSKYDCIIVHKAYYLFTCTCVSINSFHSHSHSHINSLLQYCTHSGIIVSYVWCTPLICKAHYCDITLRRIHVASLLSCLCYVGSLWVMFFCC